MPVIVPKLKAKPAATVLFVAIVDAPPNEIVLPRLIAVPFVCTVPFTVTEPGLVELPAAAMPPIKVKMPPLPKLSAPAFRKLTAFVKVLVPVPFNDRA